MSEKQPKLKFEEDKERTATRSPPKKSKVEQSKPKKQKLKQDADKAAEKAQHLRFGKAEITPDEASRMTKQQKRAMYAAAAARSAVHREVDQYEDDNVGTQALSEGEKAAGNVRDISKSIYARKLKKKAKMQGKKGAKTAQSSPQKPTAAQDAGASGTGEGGSNWLSRWRQKQDIRQSYYAAAHSGTAAQTAGGKAASNGASATRSGVEQVIDKGRSVVSTAVNGIANFAKSNAHVLLIVGVFLLLLLLVMSAFSSCSILFSGTTQVSGQTIYTAEDRDIRGAETDYKKLEKELDKKIKRTPADHPGYDEYRYHALHEKIKKAEGTMREQLIAQHKQLTKQLFRTPAKACTDKRLKYVRYADDFLIAVNGTREECEAIKAKLTDFVRDTLKMELSQEKTLITHSNTPTRFLGFDVRVRRDASVKRSGKRKMRTMNNKVELNIPLKDKVETYLLSHSIAKRDGKRLIPIHRPILLNRTDLEIVMIYNAELRGLCNYYAIASNFNKLVYFGYLMEYSCLKTLANKHRSRISKVRYEYRDGTGAWGVPYETKKGKRRMMFAKYSDCKGKDLTEKVPDLAYRYSHNTTSFEERLKAKVCEVCGCTDSDSYEIHHVNKVKNLKGKADWEKVMLAKRRKTIVVCHKCHMRIHHGTKTE